MALHIVRFQRHDYISWGILEKEQVYPLDIPCTTTRALLETNRRTLRASMFQTPMALGDVELLSPITLPAKILCQGANYRQHMVDSGLNPDEKKFNMFFTKSTASMTGPQGLIIKPKHVSLLDYEIELTLVLGKQTNGPVQVTTENLHEYVAAICIGNDISARDIQIPQMQFHKGKSYRTFCPLGPVLCLLDANEMHYLNELELQLTVNGEVRQQDSTANLVFKPAESLTELSQFQDFEPGDVLMTGTPSGCAMKLPSPFLVRLFGLIPESKRWPLFIKKQQRRSQYLKALDVVESRIISKDGRINLGFQSHIVQGE